MPDVKQFRLPDVGEGLTEAEIVTWKVKPGDTVRTNDIVVEIETAKSLVELPTPFAGVVTELLVAEGTTVDVGTPIISVDVDPSGSAPATSPDAGSHRAQEPPGAVQGATDVEVAPEEGAIEPGLIGGPAPGGRTSVLVGYGPRTTSAKRRPRKANMDTFTEEGVKPVRHGGFEIGRMVSQELAEEAELPPVEPHRAPHTDLPGHLGHDEQPVAHVRALAKPPVRKLAKDMGIDLTSVPASGPGGVVTREDVQAHASGVAEPAAQAAPVVVRAAGERETRVPIKGVRKMTAQAMVGSAFTAPHVTEFVTIDATRTMKLVERLRADREFRDVKVSPLLIVAKAMLIAAKRNPEINASWDEANQEIVVKHYVNLGIAAATPRGLVVPNIKDAHTLSLRELADALAALTETARAGRTQPAEMSGGTMSITNVGVFGVDTGTPILNPGEAAILCIGQIAERPWVHKGKLAVRQVTTLGLSFDHRLVDGDLGSRFIADVAAVLERPERALVWA
ncbi:dihydrolipoamide acetyltransferase family protein [Angustibacter sp. McL0619]|uniref:dihydrolipoamide acetyltransferase family protein n=1 Tax=Angustibacter sp. McL0619 TaxID=3415676 RepID=UPI003CE76D4F